MCGLKIVEGGISEVAPLLSMDLLSLTMIVRGSEKTKDSESEVINFEEELEVKVATHVVRTISRESTEKSWTPSIRISIIIIRFSK